MTSPRDDTGGVTDYRGTNICISDVTVASGADARRALTLVELLVALTILVIVMTSTMLVFRGVTRAWRSGQLRTERYQQARLLFDVFTRELSSCVVNPHDPFVGHHAGQTEQRFKPDSVKDEVFFVGALPGRAGLVERGYWVNSRGELFCHDQEPADGDYLTGTDEVCGTDITDFTVSYFDGTQWLTDWDGHAEAVQAGRIPKAIRISVMIGPQGGEPFETVIFIPTS